MSVSGLIPRHDSSLQLTNRASAPTLDHMTDIDTRPSWDKTYMTLCYVMAQRSPDESTKVGCVITTSNHIPVAMGYNGLPRGIDNDPRYQQRPEKYFFFEHAERNAFYNASNIGVPMKMLDTICYITWVPCADCARAILQEEVGKVVIHKQGQEALDDSRGDVASWGDSHKAAMHMLETAKDGPEIEWYDGDIITDIYGQFTEIKYDFVENPDGIIVAKRRIE